MNGRNADGEFLERLRLIGEGSDPEAAAAARTLLEALRHHGETDALGPAGEGGHAGTIRTAPEGTVAVLVGGAGGMGRILRGFLERAGAEVRILERDDWPKAREILAGATLCVVSVPIDVTEAVIARLGPLLPPDCILADVTSVKRAPVAAMLKAHAGPVLGLHPMFGPDVRNLEKQVFVAVPAREPQAGAWLLEALRREEARVVVTSAESHDRAMAIIQALRHFTTYAYGVFLAKLAPDLKEIMALSSPIYRLELEMVGRLFAQDPHLYADIILSSDENAELIRAYVESLGPELELVLNRDRDAFVERFEGARDYFGEAACDFLKESGRMLALLQKDRR